MGLGASLVGGFAGALALTLTHETLRHTVHGSPRMDVLGARGLKKVLGAAGLSAPRGQALFEATLLSDIVSNAVCYAAAGSGKGAPLRGALLGASFGIGALVLPEPLGLGKQPGRQSPRTELLTIGIYTMGGLVSGIVAEKISASH